MMRAAAEQLAVKLPRHLPGPVLIIGVAETALCLGAAVHRAFVQARGRSDAVFLASTRHALETPLLVSLQEEHGHALPHRLHRPIDPETLRLVRGARSLILVDNEMSTGQTFVNLANALATAGLNDARRIVLAVLTDWSDGRAVAALGPTATTASLLAGRYRWTPRPGGTMLPEVPRPVSAPPTAPWPLDSRKDWGRLGRRDVKPRLFAEARKGERLLIVGTGEYVWEPFLLAESLEAQGADVLVSAATRSPIAPGHSIGRAFAFQDNYGEGIANYLYNVDPAAFDRILLCTEMPARLLDPAFIAALGAPEILSSADAS